MNDRIRMGLEALRSGKYRKGEHFLHDVTGEYCVLGVLCEVYIQETGLLQWELDSNTMREDCYSIAGQVNALPHEVRDWYGFRCTGLGWGEAPVDSVWYLNDQSDMTLAQLADVIEEHCSELVYPIPGVDEPEVELEIVEEEVAHAV